jgi:hypothetical protein
MGQGQSSAPHYARAEGLRGRCRPVIDHRGESSYLDMLGETPMLEAFERE